MCMHNAKRWIDGWRRSHAGDESSVDLQDIVRSIAFPVLGAVLILFLFAVGSLLGVELTENRSQKTGAAGDFYLVNGVEMHVRIIGDPHNDPTGAPLLLIHGFTVSGGHEYDRIIPELVSERSLIIPDLLGFGHSQRLKHLDRRYSRAGQARLLVELMDQLSVEQVDIAATSYGGSVALHLVLDRADLVRRMALIDAQVEDLQSAAYRSLCELPLDLNRVILWNYQGSSPVSEAIALENCGQIGYCPTEAELKQRKEIASIEGTTEALTSFCLSQSNINIVNKLHLIQSPLLVIWGQQDEVLSQRQRRLLIEHAEVTKQVLMPRTGHAPHLEQPAEVARILLQFFNPSGYATLKG